MQERETLLGVCEGEGEGEVKLRFFAPSSEIAEVAER